MKFNKYYLMSAVFCMALASCSDDMTEEQGGNPDNTEQTEGEATYATFSFDFNKGGLVRAEVDGSGIQGERDVNNFTLLIFKNDQAHEELSTLEVVKTVSNVTDDNKTITMLVTSGPKKVYILANATKLLAQINDPDALTLNKTLLSEFEKQVFDIAYDGNADNKNGVLGDATDGLLMTGVASADLASGIKVKDFTSNASGPTDAARPNVVNVSIDRASSKISMGVNDVVSPGDKTFTVVASGSTAQMVWLDHEISENLGTLPLANDAMRFAIYNQNTKENVIANMGAANDGNNIIQDPNYTVTDHGDYSMYFNWASNNQTDFYTTYKSNNGDVTKGLEVVNAKSNDDSANSFYVPENTNQWATKGNTTYAMIEGTFVPDQTRTVDASSDANAFQAASVSGNFLFKAKDAAIAAGTGFIYCEDYDAFFTADLTSGILTRKTDITTSIHSLKAIKYIAAKMISDANQSATGKEDAMQAKLIGGENSDVKGHALTTVEVVAKTPTASFTGNQWYAIVTADENRNVGIKDGDKDNAQYFTIEVRRANDQGSALIATADNNSATEAGSTKAYIPTQKVTIAVYPQGKCYYRVNIEDPAYSNTVTPFRYAVIRNYWYQIDLAKFTALGYPNPAIAAGEAADALGADTNVKTTITVKPWSVKNMKPEVGL